jgi:hypothetical protein
MKTILKSIAMGIGSFVMLFILTQVQATETDVVLNLEGNPTCSSLGDNELIVEIRDNDPLEGHGVDGKVVSDGQQYIRYMVNDNGDTVTFWEIEDYDPETVRPVNYAILKARGNAGAKVYHFGGEGAGAVTDQNEAANGQLTALSFCYGLSTGFEEPDPAPIILSELPACEDLGVVPDNNNGGVSNDPADLYDAGIICPASGEQLIINLGLNLPHFGFDADNIRACTCNVENQDGSGDLAGLPQCNPDLEAYDLATNGAQNAESWLGRSCMEYGGPDGATVPAGVNERVPFLIQGVENPDSYVCYTIGGTRYCYGHY